MFRKKAEAFAYDHIALGIVKGMTDEEILSYAIQEQAFLLLPYQHSEDKEDQVKSLSLAQTIVEKAKAAGAAEGAIGLVLSFHKYAIEHSEIIAKFGRYPHRNEQLGRESTPEELEYLKSA